MGVKLNEVAACYLREEWDHFYLAVAGTDCEILLDMFSKLFRPPEILNPTNLETPATNKAQTEAEHFEEEALHCEGGPDASKPDTLLVNWLSLKLCMALSLWTFIDRLIFKVTHMDIILNLFRSLLAIKLANIINIFLSHIDNAMEKAYNNAKLTHVHYLLLQLLVSHALELHRLEHTG